MQQNSVLHFDSYLEYLNTVARKSGSRRLNGLTHDHWAKKLGYRSPRSIAMVLKGQRYPSVDMIQKICRDLKFSLREEKYFFLLVEKEKKSKSKQSVNLILDMMDKLKKNVSTDPNIDMKIFSYIGEWYHFVLLELIQRPGFIEDLAKIKQRLRNKVGTTDIQFAIKRMLDIGLLRRNKENKLEATNSHIITTSDISSDALKSHHRQMIARATEALLEQPLENREITSVTFRLDKKKLPEAKEVIRKFRENFKNQFSDDQNGSVYNLNFQLFEHEI